VTETAPGAPLKACPPADTDVVVASGVLVVLRGNSGSGKSTVAALIKDRVPKGSCLVVSQDAVRRDMLGEDDAAGAANIMLLEVIANWGLDRGLLVIVEGILNSGRYQRMLERLGTRSRAAHFFAWDLSFEETARRHDQRTKRGAFSVDEMRSWFHGWQPLDFTAEVRFDHAMSADSAAITVLERALGDGLQESRSAASRRLAR
jgi:predicted kinase